MSIAQRGTSQASITTDGYFTVDRMRITQSSLGTWTQSQSTDVPTGQGFAKSLKMDCTTADASPSAGDYFIITHKIEGQNLQYIKKGTSNAESLTLSFWVKSNKTGTYIAEIEDLDNARTINKSYTISSASTWEKKTITFDGDTTGTLDNDNNASFFLNLFLGAGSNFTSGTLQTSWGSSVTANRAVGQVNLADSTSNEWYITGVQLEAGDTASDFEFLPVDINLHRCERYFRKIGDGMGGAVNALHTMSGGTCIQPPLRANPSVSLNTTSIKVGDFYSGDYVSTSSAITLNRCTKSDVNIFINGWSTPWSAGRPITFWGTSGGTFISLDSEL
jgi:hypothetical protein